MNLNERGRGVIETPTEKLMYQTISTIKHIKVLEHKNQKIGVY
jgi:hypothetical protein